MREPKSVRIAKESDLIVMGTHGRMGLSRLLIGTVAEAVSRKAHCPVLNGEAPLPGNQQRRSLPPRLSHESASRSHALSERKKSSFNLDFPDGVVRTH